MQTRFARKPCRETVSTLSTQTGPWGCPTSLAATTCRLIASRKTASMSAVRGVRATQGVDDSQPPRLTSS